MAKEPRRKCSHCGHNGHNSRTCNGKGCIKLFGVKINVMDDDNTNNHLEREDECMRKCKSMGNLQACNAENNNNVDAGYLSDGLIQSPRAKAAHERRKGRPWTEHEHRSFLIGLEKLGKGDWRGISKSFVPTRTPTQVASHAQKYFLRLAASEKRKRKSSVFDIALNQNSPQTPRSLACPTSPSNEAPGSSQRATSPVAAAMKRNGEIKAQACKVVPITTFDRPPLSPIGISPAVLDFRPMPYMVGASSGGHGQTASTVMPTASFVQVMNFPNRNVVYLQNFNGKFATCSPMIGQPPSSMLTQQHPSVPPTQAAPNTPLTDKDGVDLSLGALTL